MLVMFTIRPARRFIMPLITAFVVWNAPLRLASSTASQSASVSRSRRLSRVSPALFTRMSMGPSADSAAAMAASTWTPSATLQANPAARSPSSAAMAADRACSRPTTATLAPAPWRARAMASPMPRVLPVTKATLPARSIVVMALSCRAKRGIFLGYTPKLAAFRNERPRSLASLGMTAPCSCQEPLHLVRRPQRDRTRPRHDAFEQPRQHVPRPDLDVRRPRHQARRGQHARHPPHRRGQLVYQQPLGVDAGAHLFAAGVGDHGEGRIAERHAGERIVQPVHRRRHERRVKRTAHF